uniref:Uncharacterized protein n=1 Tax=Steinernema glaseri TaxID=37863 RepID=A0A1I7Z6H2_9BILA
MRACSSMPQTCLRRPSQDAIPLSHLAPRWMHPSRNRLVILAQTLTLDRLPRTPSATVCLRDSPAPSPQDQLRAAIGSCGRRPSPLLRASRRSHRFPIRFPQHERLLRFVSGGTPAARLFLI